MSARCQFRLYSGAPRDVRVSELLVYKTYTTCEFRMKNEECRMQAAGSSELFFGFRDSKWYARPVTLRIQALI